MHLLSEGQIKCFCFRLETQLLPDISTNFINTTAVTETTPPFFMWTFGRHYASISTPWRRHVGACLGVDESQLYKEYLFGFETLVFATLGIFSMHNQLVTLQRERKIEIA